MVSGKYESSGVWCLGSSCVVVNLLLINEARTLAVLALVVLSFLKILPGVPQSLYILPFL